MIYFSVGSCRKYNLWFTSDASSQLSNFIHQSKSIASNFVYASVTWPKLIDWLFVSINFQIFTWNCVFLQRISAVLCFYNYILPIASPFEALTRLIPKFRTWSNNGNLVLIHWTQKLIMPHDLKELGVRKALMVSTVDITDTHLLW